jgi:VanZ family protein
LINTPKSYKMVLSNKNWDEYNMHISKRQNLHIFLSWTAVICWMLVIFTLSAQPGPESTNLSDRLTEIMIEKTSMLVPLNVDTSTGTGFIKLFRLILRKSAHVAEYFMLGLLVMNAMKTSNVPRHKAFTLSLAICILYALSDEIHQYFVPGREAQISDVLIDSLGALAGIGIRPLIKRRNSPSYVE